MRKTQSSNNGFSLTEVLLAIGVITVGMLFIAGAFPVGIHFTTIATERTISAVVANEAFAKIRLYGVADFNSWPALPVVACVDYRDVSTGSVNSEYAYPSDPNIDISEKQYYWSALCRRVDTDPNSRLVQVTVFVSRKVGSGTTFRGWAGNWPVPVPVPVSMGPGPKELTITNPAEKTFINDGYTVVGNEYGRIFRVLERYDTPGNDQTIRLDLDRLWGPGNISPSMVWVIPPPVGGGRCPFIAIYQRVVRF
ncbi:MAG: prepilin-type N-terminal cleavage/methylation domain-containing protein [Phycisphaerae bacterium]|nr:prepilin-type N-terminal cleavage/methylation domain-containing protein [Phycisphaerae bacterium]NIR66777.1 prepilin-type N-terminal cleavage/methylation domain-containing protein [candidate division Zixibacteria bacterium]NIP52646.1 prepilin-type N-terminal cleavage/methylation domain-containing protein [Phycisphaerae bacterium]NIS49851.1 prepilin-type N-terminal cleavage/methylation domain-containing protein [Phycisphaerae bacterium]NIU07944.1 prepilin-type N-terminal cleavage/methylation 